MIHFSARRTAALAGSILAAAAAYAAAPPAQAARTPAPPSWTIAKVLDPNHFGVLLTVTADSANDAWTFGQTGSGSPAALHWNGSAWAGSAVPGAFTRAGFVSATGPGNVWSGGAECYGGPPGPDVFAAYVARYNGHTWATAKWNTSAYCGGAMVTTGPRNGWLFGNKQAMHFTGRWGKVSLPSLGQSTAATAVSAGDIWVIGGTYPSDLSRSKTYFTHYDGRAWRTVPLPPITLPKKGYLYPYDVTAASASSIWAAVTVEPAGAQSFLLHWNGTAWQPVALPVTPYQLLRLTPDGQGGVWALMVQAVNGDYKFAHYLHGSWAFDAVPTNGLPGFVPGGSYGFDLYAMSRIPGSTSMLATGDVSYFDSKGVQREYSLIFRYGP